MNRFALLSIDRISNTQLVQSAIAIQLIRIKSRTYKQEWNAQNSREN